MGVSVLLAMTLLAVTGTLSAAKVLSGFSNVTVWLIFSAFLFARAVTQTGFGMRVGYLFIERFGRTPLRLGYSLAAADLGMAVGAGTDVAISAADLILLREDLRVVPEAIQLARAARATIRRNLAWAFGYNAAAVPLAALGFLNPLIAAAAMTLSSVLVVASSLRLRRFRPSNTL